jgi:universal stress protein A
MFQFIPVHESNVYAVRVSGKLSHEDYQNFLPDLEVLIKSDEKISLLIELDDFHGIDISAIKDDIKFSIRHNDAFEKVAIVGEKKWHRWMTLLSTPFFKGSVKYFNRIDLQDAWDWLRIKKYSDDELANRHVDDYKNVMACVDFSPHSKRAVRRAMKIVKESNAKLVLVNVVDESALYDLYYDPAGMGFTVTEFSQEGLEGSMTLVESLIDKSNTQMKALLSELGLSQEQGIVLTGRPNSTLNSYAEAQDIDLIVMGTHGRRGIDRVLGSSTRYVQSHARCEVLSVPLVNY